MQPPIGTQESAPTREMPPIPPADQTPLPPASLLTASQGEACAKCAAPLRADQRYCIECGERRGDPRLPFMDGSTAALSDPAGAANTPPPGGYPPPVAAPPANKWSSGLALLSTIAVLLLAMGVGVLIGGEGSSNSSAQQPVIIGGAAGATGEATGATGKAAAASTAAVAEEETGAGVDASALAKKNGVKLAKPDVDLGDKCEKGSVGCNEDGEFDGEYFPE